MSKEREARVWPGWPMLALTIALYVFGSVMLDLGATWQVWTGLGALALAVLSSLGFFTLQPNEARVLILFGRYKGTTRQVGFLWGNPLFSNGSTGRRSRPLGRRDPGTAQAARRVPRYKISLRARTLNGERLKVNDRSGNPVDIAAVVVWHVEDNAQAIFDVDDSRLTSTCRARPRSGTWRPPTPTTTEKERRLWSRCAATSTRFRRR